MCRTINRRTKYGLKMQCKTLVQLHLILKSYQIYQKEENSTLLEEKDFLKLETFNFHSIFSVQTKKSESYKYLHLKEVKCKQ